jgi:hypothetical protein
VTDRVSLFPPIEPFSVDRLRTCMAGNAAGRPAVLADSDLRIVPDGSHSPLEPGMIHELVTASEDFKALFG